jgi:NAD(P)H-hydrate epimerase
VIPVLSREQMRAFDARAIAECRVPSIVLMENAGRGAADVITREVFGGSADGKKAVVVCGTGNNGGDGFVVARHLHARGARVVAWLVGGEERLTTDARVNRDAFVGVGGTVGGGTLDTLRRAMDQCDVVVDALFGTGLDRPVALEYADLVRAMNLATSRRVALDVPSGLSANTGVPMGECVRAHLTVTFAHPKLGHMTASGAERSGELRVVDIGVPPDLADMPAAMAIEPSDVSALLRPRAESTHKYRAGHVAVIGGSPGKSGAPLLAARGALRAGAGACTVVSWPSSVAAVSGAVLELMTASIEGDSDAERRASLDRAAAGKRALVLGPGFGTGADAASLVHHALATFPGPIVVDADALTVFAGRHVELRAGRGVAILTPHSGELARLFGVTADDIDKDRFGWARRAARETQAVVILKGAYSLVAAPDGRVVVVTAGNPALATAGSGDVLAGVVAAMACALDPFEAAFAGAFVHGEAGDRWAEAHGDRGLFASEIADLVPAVVRALAR